MGMCPKTLDFIFLTTRLQEWTRKSTILDQPVIQLMANSGIHADNWFKHLRNDVFPLLPQNRKPRKRVKIAILDTGIDMSESFISTNSTRITTENFLSNESSVEDVHGHGTHAAALLLQIAENADIYVARIAKDENSIIDPKNIEKVRNLLLSNLGRGIDSCN